MEPTPPFWFKQRQASLAAAGENLYEVKAPNMEPLFVLIRPAASGGWQGAVRRQADGPDVSATVRGYGTRADAWHAAFELLRVHTIV